MVGHLSGLQLGIVYHFRVVATNKLGPPTAPTRPSTSSPRLPQLPRAPADGGNYLPDCRAYELVSPAGAGQHPVLPGGHLTGSPPRSSPARHSHPRLPEHVVRVPPPASASTATRRPDGPQPPNFLSIAMWRRGRPGLGHPLSGRRATKPLSLRPQCSLTLDKCIDYRPPFSLVSRHRSAVPIRVERRRQDPRSLADELQRRPRNADHRSATTSLVADFCHFVFSSLSSRSQPGGLEARPGRSTTTTSVEKTVGSPRSCRNGDPIPRTRGATEEEFIGISRRVSN